MKIKSFLAKPFASYIHKQIRKGMQSAVEDQKKILRELLKTGKHTDFGKEHKLGDISTYEEYRQSVPIRDYEKFKPYIDRVKEGRHDVLWKGQPIYFAKTSGTTSGVKYIPISSESISNHINTARNALLCYIAESGNHLFTNGKMIFLSGSPELERVAGIPTGRLSGIVNHHIPSYLRKNQLPTYETNCIEDWETKLDNIVAETKNEDMTLISGIPPWMQMYFDRLNQVTGKKIMDIFPNFNVMVHGGVNFEPYKAKLFDSIGKPVDTIETFPAPEGFFAFQDSRTEEGQRHKEDHQPGVIRVVCSDNTYRHEKSNDDRRFSCYADGNTACRCRGGLADREHDGRYASDPLPPGQRADPFAPGLQRHPQRRAEPAGRAAAARAVRAGMEGDRAHEPGRSDDRHHAVQPADRAVHGAVESADRRQRVRVALPHPRARGARHDAASHRHLADRAAVGPARTNRAGSAA